MNIKDDEINIMLKDIKVLIDDEKNKELIQTLKIYLECKMNFSLTAKTLYVHINTVRKRIEEITTLLEGEEVSLEQSIELYKEGATLLAFCGEKLKAAEQQVNLLVKKDGSFYEEAFDGAEEE